MRNKGYLPSEAETYNCREFANKLVTNTLLLKGERDNSATTDSVTSFRNGFVCQLSTQLAARRASGDPRT